MRLPVYERRTNSVLVARLAEPRRFIQALLGARQVGKTTSMLQVLEGIGLPSHYASADDPSLQTREWIAAEWETARRLGADADGRCILVLDEVQKIPRWSDVVKQLWDEDSRHRRDVRVAILGSSPWLMGRGLTESLAGRFEIIPATHWTYRECRDAFGWDLDTFVFFGGYPGAASLVDEETRWRDYVKANIIETTVSREVLHLTRVDKPALLRRVFYLACEYSGRELSLRKMLGQLEDAGNATTIAHYLDLLDGAGLAVGLQKYAGHAVRRRASSPKLQVHNNALMSAVSGRTFGEVRRDEESWGRWVESCVGAHLLALARTGGWDLCYWRDADREVDYVARTPRGVIAFEVKSGRRPRSQAGLMAFRQAFKEAQTLVVGTGGTALEDFLSRDELPET